MVDVRYMSDKIDIEPIEYLCPRCNAWGPGMAHRSHCNWLVSELPKVGEGPGDGAKMGGAT